MLKKFNMLSNKSAVNKKIPKKSTVKFVPETKMNIKEAESIDEEDSDSDKHNFGTSG